jgi:hypothetical protein
MIGCLQWDVYLGRFVIQTATMTVLRFRCAPQQEHLTILKRNMVTLRSSQPYLGNLPDQDFDLCYKVYSNVHELNSTDAPDSLGNCVTTVTYTDTHLYHDILNGRSMT